MEQNNALRERFPLQPDFQLSYTLPEVTGGSSYLTPAHWHEHVELLYIVKGELRVNLQGSWKTGRPGEILAVNPGQIHGIPEKNEETFYGCLIPHKPLCSRMGIPVEQIHLPPVIRDSGAAAAVEAILGELREKPRYYKASVQAKTLDLLTMLARKYCGDQNPGEGDRKARLVKEAVAFVSQHYGEAVSTGDVCNALGFDKSYLCNTFKAITGTTILEHLNMVRCERARELLMTGECSVTDCAAQCGFHNLSYFTKTYKRYVGQLPSETGKKGSPG